MNLTKAILVDIEGTTSSISFVHEVLFPYAKEKLENFIREKFDKEEVNKLIQETLDLAKVQTKDKKQMIELASKQLLEWINEDKKIKVLKELQGLIWEDGYKSGAFHGHIYEDAYKNLSKWKADGYKLYVYSSGSAWAQKLLFAHTEYGDLNNLFSANFDTQIGAKKDPRSYSKISNEIKIQNENIVFLSDNEDELKAAQEAGMGVIKLVRPEDKIADSDIFLSVKNFDEIEL